MNDSTTIDWVKEISGADPNVLKKRRGRPVTGTAKTTGERNRCRLNKIEQNIRLSPDQWGYPECIKILGNKTLRLQHGMLAIQRLQQLITVELDVAVTKSQGLS